MNQVTQMYCCWFRCVFCEEWRNKSGGTIKCTFGLIT